MSLFTTTLHFFQELSLLPRLSHHERLVREWLKNWADTHAWRYEEDTIGNLLIVAPGKIETTLALQSHMDMVCVADYDHDFHTKGIQVLEKDGILYGNNTSLGADNGIGVALMMALAETTERPTLELLFTMGEEVGLIGAHNIDLPLTAPYAINLDWCHSDSIGIGCGGTLLMDMSVFLTEKKPQGNPYTLSITGMLGGHSGVEIQYNRGNALIEICRLIDVLGIQEFSDLRGGEADNAIPHSASIVIASDKNRDKLETSIHTQEQHLRDTYNTDIHLSFESTPPPLSWYDAGILTHLHALGTGVQILGPENTPLSSWNLGKMKTTKNILSWCYFLRTNIPHGIQPMKEKITTALEQYGVTQHCSHEGPVWLTDASSPFIHKILANINENNPSPIPAITMHATMEAGTLAEKYPDTQWVSIGATCHNMHTTREHIHLSDLEEFCERLEIIIKFTFN